MKRKLIIDGNAVYELDEECMLQQKVEKEKTQKDREQEQRLCQNRRNNIYT